MAKIRYNEVELNIPLEENYEKQYSWAWPSQLHDKLISHYEDFYKKVKKIPKNRKWQGFQIEINKNNIQNFYSHYSHDADAYRYLIPTFDDPKMPLVEVKFSDKKGCGLFAKQNIPANIAICEYIGDYFSLRSKKNKESQHKVQMGYTNFVLDFARLRREIENCELKGTWQGTEQFIAAISNMPNEDE
jgi:hypothetical protein